MPDMTPYSSPWWLERLGRKLDERDRRFDVFERYYRGDQPFPLASRKFEDAFRAIFRGFSDNFCRLVIQAVEERLTVDGFRLNDAAGSRKAWRLWQANQLDAESQKAHREALIKSEALVIVGPDPNDPTNAIIRVQEPEHVVGAYEDDPLVRAVAMKRWKAIDGRVFATLYYPDRLEKYQQARQLAWANQYAREYTLGGWEPRMVEGEDWPLRHDLGVVPRDEQAGGAVQGRRRPPVARPRPEREVRGVRADEPRLLCQGHRDAHPAHRFHNADAAALPPGPIGGLPLRREPEVDRDGPRCQGAPTTARLRGGLGRGHPPCSPGGR